MGNMFDAVAITDLLNSLERISPGGLACRACLADEIDTSTSAIDTEQIQGWALARAREFIGGRRSARSALSQVGAGADHPLSRDAEGLPSWPFGFTGSISHSLGICSAVAGPTVLFPVLGLDLERVDRISEAASARVVHPLESSFWSGRQLRASILFSLKEAFYKAQYPRWGLKANFSEMALEVDLSMGSARIVFLSERLSEAIKDVEISDFCFRFALVHSSVISICWVETEAVPN